MGRVHFFFLRRGALAALGIALGVSEARADEPPRSDETVTRVRGPDEAAPEPPHDGRQVLLLHTVIVGEKGSRNAKRIAERETERAQQLDKILSDAAQDLGFTIAVADEAADAGEISDLDLLARVHGDSWLVYPTIDLRGPDTVVRIAGVAGGSNVVDVRTEVVKANDLAVRAVVMLRDVVAAKTHGAATSIERRDIERGAPPSFATPARSVGRAVLALNGAAVGAFIGYSVQRSSGSDDPRLLYPLMALGTGVGLGASAIVTEEWDVGLGEAWFLSAGAWWPALSGWYLARGSGDVARSTAYGTSVLASFGGLAVATAALTFHHGMSEGGALMTHSGGAFGTGIGALAEFAVRGSATGPTPEQGIGYGAAAGVLLAGALATQVDIEPSRVLAVDVGVGLGGLAGAAAGSPFIFGERTPSGDRAFLATTIGGTLAGGILSWIWTTRRATPNGVAPPSTPFTGAPPPAPRSSPHAFVLPFAGALTTATRAIVRPDLPAPPTPVTLGAGLMGNLP
jgi:hypothetical protein